MKRQGFKNTSGKPCMEQRLTLFGPFIKLSTTRRKNMERLIASTTRPSWTRLGDERIPGLILTVDVEPFL
jgi:hypothetical protein